MYIVKVEDDMYVITVSYDDGNGGVTTQVIGGMSTEEESLAYVSDMKTLHGKVIEKEKELTPVLKTLSDQFRAYTLKMTFVEGAERKRRFAEYYDENTRLTNQWISDNLTEEETEMYRSPWYSDNPEWTYEELNMIVR